MKKWKIAILLVVIVLIGYEVIQSAKQEEEEVQQVEQVAFTESTLDEIFTGVDESEADEEEPTVAKAEETTGVDDTEVDMDLYCMGSAYWYELLMETEYAGKLGEYSKETYKRGVYTVYFTKGRLTYNENNGELKVEPLNG